MKKWVERKSLVKVMWLINDDAGKWQMWFSEDNRDLRHIGSLLPVSSPSTDLGGSGDSGMVMSLSSSN